MICKIVKLIVSWTDGEVPEFLRKHVDGCSRCTDYVSFLNGLTGGFKRSLEIESENIEIKYPNVKGISGDNIVEMPARSSAKGVWAGLAAAGLAGFIIISGSGDNGSETASFDYSKILDVIPSGEVIDKAASGIESPIEREIAELKKAFNSSKDFLKEGLNLETAEKAD